MLSLSQLNRLTDFAVALHSAARFEDLAAPAARALRELIPCDAPTVSFAPMLWPEIKVHFDAPRSKAQVQCDEAGHEFIHENPIYANRLRLLCDRPATPSEFVDFNTLARTNFYNAAWRPLGINRVLSFPSPGAFGYHLAVARHGHEDFTACDAAIMQTIARHLEAATERLVRSAHGRLLIDGEWVAVQKLAWLVCKSSGEILRWTPRARILFRLILGDHTPLERLPVEWMNELDRRREGRASQPIRYARRSRLVTVHIAPIKPTRSEYSVSFVESTVPPDPLAALRRMGLTSREADVMQWASEGKTNPEIGIILGISALTVKKHMENIFQKLGVENRTTAVTRALAAVECGLSQPARTAPENRIQNDA